MGRFQTNISIGLNIALTLAFILLAARSGQSPGRNSPSGRVASPPPLKEDAESSNSASLAAQTESFRWSQLESRDYRKYVANLRAIGCPDKALRAIVSSDLDEIYAKRAADLEQRLREFRDAPLSVRLSSFNSEQALRKELQQLSAEQNAQLAELLGSNSDSAPKPEELTAASTTKPAPRFHAAPQMPLVLQNVDLAALGLNADQMQVVEDLRQSFSDQVGGPDQDPNDPAYLERWQKAQPETDRQLSGMLGVKVFENYEMAVQPPANSAAQRR